jgi:hypothetical protein
VRPVGTALLLRQRVSRLLLIALRAALDELAVLAGIYLAKRGNWSSGTNRRIAQTPGPTQTRGKKLPIYVRQFHDGQSIRCSGVTPSRIAT